MIGGFFVQGVDVFGYADVVLIVKSRFDVLLDRETAAV